MLASYNDVLPATNDFTDACSRSGAKKEAVECTHHLDIVVEVEDSPPRRRGDPGQGCSFSSPPPKVEHKDESSGKDGDYIIFYNRLGIN
jgi:hypothetical protein